MKVLRTKASNSGNWSIIEMTESEIVQLLKTTIVEDAKTGGSVNYIVDTYNRELSEEIYDGELYDLEIMDYDDYVE